MIHWIIWPPADGSDTVGGLYVRNDLIVGIEHQILKRETLRDLYDALFSAISEVSRESPASCSAKTVSRTASNGTLTLISITCNGIRVTVDHADFKDEHGETEETYDVTETIGATK